MALYEFECKRCNYEFEELINGKAEVEVKCKLCGGEVVKKMSSFAPVIEGGGSAESVDMMVGREADKRWQMHQETQEKRRADQKLKQFNDLPKAVDGKFMPVMALGDKKEKETRKEFSNSLQEHRQERLKRGQQQFEDSGSF